MSDYEDVGGFSKQTITREVSILSIVSHPNIVRFFGTSYHKQNIIIVTEYFPVDLTKLIGTNNTHTFPVDKKIVFDRKQRRRVLRQIISAVAYLHARSIIHRDLKAANVLIDARREDGNFEAKICDFGSAKVVQFDRKKRKNNARRLSSGSALGEFIGSPLFSPPEALMVRSSSTSIQAPLLTTISPSSGRESPLLGETKNDTMININDTKENPSFGWDVYSFGVLMYCVTHDCLLPYSTVIMKDEQSLNTAVLNGERPMIDRSKVTEKERMLMEFCWSNEVQNRPHAAKVALTLKEESEKE